MDSEVLNKFQKIDFMSVLNSYVLPYGLKLLLALAIYYIGRKLIKFITKLVGKGMQKSGSDPMLSGFVISILDFIGFALVIIASLSQLGVDTSSFVAIIGAAGLAIGLSLKDSLQNFAAGIMILVFKPFKKGHVIEGAGVTGSVENIGLITLTLKTPDNKIVIIPNGKVFNGNIIDYSITGTRRVDLSIGIAYGADIKKAKEVMLKAMRSDSRVLKDPEPTVGVSSLADSSVQFFARVWVKTDDYFAVQADMLEAIKLALDENNVEIPYNTMDINIRTNAK